MKKIFTVIIAFLLILPLFAPRQANAQNINATISSVKFDGTNYIVKGKINLSDLNPKGQIPESDDVVIYMDIMSKKGGKWPVLPDTQWLRQGYVKGGKVLTDKELSGTNCKTITLWGWGVRRDAWKEGASEKNGRLFIDFSKIKSSYSNEFEIKIPKIYASYTVRIRAYLTHIWGGPFAAWPAFSYHHAIIYEGVLKNIAGKRDETQEQAIRNSKIKLINILRKMAHYGKKNDSSRKKKGMHIFAKPKYVNLKGAYDKKTKEKIEEFAKRNKIKRNKITKGDGSTKEKIPSDNPTLKDKCKYYAGKLGGKIVEKIPFGSAISSAVDNKITEKLGLGDIKKTQIELNVDPLAASLYNKFNCIAEREKEYAKAAGLVQTIGKYASTIYDQTIGRFWKDSKRRAALSFELEYAETVKRVKHALTSNIPLDTLKKDIINDQSIIPEYQQIKSKEFKNSDPSKYATKFSKGEFKDPVKRFEFYIQLAKEKGDLK